MPQIKQQDDQVFNLSNPIVRGIAEANTAILKRERAKLLKEQTEVISFGNEHIKSWVDEFMEEINLSESTLSKLIGDSQEGQQLARWLHKNEKLSNTAEYGLLTRGTGRVQWKMFKSNADNFLIVKGDDAVIAIKPDAGVMAANREKAASRGKNYNPSTDNEQLYQLVGYNANERIDNQLIPYPDPADFGFNEIEIKQLSKDPRGFLAARPGLVSSQSKYKEYADAIAKVDKIHKQAISNAAPPTRIISGRGGVPFKMDHAGCPHNLFDRIKQVLGNNMTIYTAVSHLSDVPKDSVKGLVGGYKSAEIPKGDIQGAFGEPSIGNRKETGIERDKMSLRRPDIRVDFNSELSKFFKRVRPVMSSIVSKVNTFLKTKHETALARRDVPSLRKIAEAMHQINQFEEALNDSNIQGNVAAKVLTAAISKVSGTTPGDRESIQFLTALNNPTSRYGEKLADRVSPVLKAIYSTLIAGKVEDI